MARVQAKGPFAGVDPLLPVPDAALQAEGKAYLAKHGIDKLFGDLLYHMVEHKPGDPIQFVIDSLEYNMQYAAQDPETGLPEHRKTKLADVFKVLDKEGHGKVSLSNLQSYASKYGGTSLSDSELQSIFSDFQPGEENLITLQEFLIYFSKVSRTIPNQAFDTLIKDMMA